MQFKKIYTSCWLAGMVSPRLKVSGWTDEYRLRSLKPSIFYFYLRHAQKYVIILQECCYSHHRSPIKVSVISPTLNLVITKVRIMNSRHSTVLLCQGTEKQQFQHFFSQPICKNAMSWVCILIMESLIK